MMIICSYIMYDCNNPLRLTHFFQNDSSSRIKSITLVNAIDLAHCAAQAVYCKFENKDAPLQVYGVSDLTHELCY